MDQQTLQHFADTVKAELGLHSFSLYLTRNGDIKLDMLAVAKESRKQGVGSVAMERLTQFADAHSLRVVLTTGVRDPHWGTTSAARLISFYKRFGFVHNSGRSKDFTISENMYREPKMKKQTFREFYNATLVETPLPDDWDGAMFNERIPFAKRVAYAKARAFRIGSGSSRIAFVIPYEGRQTVLKIAKNAKGMAQNEFEAQMFSDYYANGLGITIPMIDYDENSARPTWIHTELAQKAKESDFVKACGGTLDDLLANALRGCGKLNTRGHYSSGDPDKIPEDNELASSLTDLIGNYDIPSGDFSRLANWGIYNGSPVIIDLGLSSQVMADHYSPKKRANAW